MRLWLQSSRSLQWEDLSVTAFDGLKLTGRYHEYVPGAPVEILFHGYRGTADRDLSGGVHRCRLLGHNCLLVDQRCSGGSEGKSITFGICEHRDCLAWVDLAVEKLGADVKLILTGISMGAATVLMAAGNPLPENVIGILADCGYSTPKAIICKVLRDKKYPVKFMYPFVRLGARIFGGFDLEETSPLAAMEKCSVPVIFFHGEEDGYVPCDMSREVYEACHSRKRLVTVPGADHGLCFPKDPEGYLSAMKEFFAEEPPNAEKT
jgi:pimeloyl-ACP methyl ester carboxylesterase